MSIPNNNPNCLGASMSMSSEQGGHPGAQDMMQHQYGHHMGHADYYMNPPQQGEHHQFHGQQQWYVQHQTHGNAMMHGAPGAPAQQDYRQLPHQQQYHHQQQQPYHMDMNGARAGTGGWNTVQNNAVQMPVPDPVLPIKDDKEIKDESKNPTEEKKTKGKKVVKKTKASKVKVKNEEGKSKVKKQAKKGGKVEKVEKLEISSNGGDENLREVSAQFTKGCDCVDQNCYEGMDPEVVYKHRLNIDELTKLEHDMYLMGITMACLEGSDETHRHTERKRFRSKYRFKGKEVCLGAFLFLEHTTLHHLKSIRKHVRDHGVTPRIHGNHRKRPHNTFPLDIYQRATKFLQAYFEKNSFKEAGSAKKKGLICLPSTINCKKIHSEYKIFCQLEEPDGKLMGYSTFRHFIKDQFPNLRFHRDEKTSLDDGVGNNINEALLLHCDND